MEVVVGKGIEGVREDATVASDKMKLTTCHKWSLEKCLG
jgi:hypothetical protein